MLIDYVRNLSLELEMDLDDFKTDDSNVYTFDIEGDLTIEMKQIDEGIYILTELCDTPETDEEQIYFEAMCATLFGQATYGNTVGISDNSKKMLLSRYIEYDASYESFRALLEDFVNAATFWAGKISVRA